MLGPVLFVMTVLVWTGALRRSGLGEVDVGGHVARTAGQYLAALAYSAGISFVGLAYVFGGHLRTLPAPLVRYRYLAAALGLFCLVLAYDDAAYVRDMDDIRLYELTVSGVDDVTGRSLPVDITWPTALGATEIVRLEGSAAGSRGAMKRWLATGPAQVQVSAEGYEGVTLTVRDTTSNVEVRLQPSGAIVSKGPRHVITQGYEFKSSRRTEIRIPWLP